MSATVSCMSNAVARRNRAHAIKKAERAANTPQKRRHPRPERPPIALRLRVHRLARGDIHVRYDVGVGERRVNREAWAEVVSRLINQETAGNQSRFAALVGVTYKTIRRWLKGESDVSEDSVRQVARAVGISPLELLMRVGYYSPSDLDAPTPVEQLAAGDDRALQVILEADVPPRVKQRMIHRLQELRRRQVEREVDEVRWWIEQARGA